MPSKIMLSPPNTVRDEQGLLSRASASGYGCLPCGGVLKATGSWGRGRLLVRRNARQITVKRHCPVDGGCLVSRGQQARILARARDAVIPPDVLRLAVEEGNRLHTAWTENGHQQVTHRAYVFRIEPQPIGKGASDAHPVNRLAGQVVLLSIVQALAFRHFARGEVFATSIAGRIRQGVGVEDKRLPALVSGRPIPNARVFRDRPDTPATTLDSGGMPKSRHRYHQCREARI